MEYQLQLEEQRRYRILILSILGIILCAYFAFSKLGAFGLVVISGVLAITLLSPLLVNKYKFLLYCLIFSLIFLELKLVLIGLFIPIALVFLFLNINYVLKMFKPAFLTIFFIIFLISSLAWYNPGMQEAYREIRFPIIQLFVIALSLFYFKKHQSVKLFNFINIMITGNSLIALFQRVTGIGLFYDHTGLARIAGLYAHPNSLGIVLNIFIPLCLFIILNIKDEKHKLFWKITTAINLLTLLLTFSKTSILLLIISFGVFFLFFSGKQKIQFGLIIITSLVLFIIANYVFNLEIISSIIYRLNNTGSWEWRVEFWRDIMAKIDELTVIRGNGIISCQNYMFRLSPINNVYNPHNVYLEKFFNYGIWSLLYFLPFFYLLKDFFKGFLQKKGYCIYPFVITIVILISMVASPAAGSRFPFLIFWVVMMAFYTRSVHGWIDENNYKDAK